MIENMLETCRVAGSDFCVRWSLTLLHFVWQAALVGLLALIAERLLVKRSAVARYTLHAMALLSLPFCVAVTFAIVTAPSATQDIASFVSPSEGMGRDTEIFTAAGHGRESSALLGTARVQHGDAGAAIGHTEQTSRQGLPASSPPMPRAPSVVEPAPQRLLLRAAPLITGVYLAAIVCLLLRLLLAIRGGNRLRAQALPLADPQVLELIIQQTRRMGMRFVPLVAYCEQVAVPTVVGVLRPVILLPISSLTGLDSQQLIAIIGHELAHIRRYDLAVNLLQRLIESLLFFHPAVWYLSRRMSAEREACCDDLVVRSGCERSLYADAMLRAAELCAAERHHRAAALAATGGGQTQLEQRIWRLLDTHGHPRQRLTRGGMLMMTSVVTFTILALTMLGGTGRAENDVDSSKVAQSETDDDYIWDCSTVDETTGSPVAGVHVTWRFRGPYRPAEGTNPLLWEGTFVSDQNGEYQVRVPRAIVDAVGFGVGIEYHHPRYLPQRGSTWPLRMPKDPLGKVPDHRHIQLVPGVKVFGVISNPDGSPARGVPVMFARSRDGFGDSNGGYYHGFWTSTGDDGRYEFYTRNTWPQRIHWYPAEYAADSRDLTREFGEQLPIRLKPGFVLTGKVIDAQGQPLAGIAVRASTGTRVPYLFATSDAEGIYRFTPLPAGAYRLTPVRSYHDTHTGDSLSASLPYPIPSIEYTLDASANSPDPQAIIQASPLITIPVEVADGEGNPISDRTLSIGDMGNFTNAVLATPVEGVPGRYEFQFPRDQYIRDLAYRRSMGDAVFYQLNTAHPPVAAEAIVLGKAQEDFPTIRVVVRKAASLTVLARTEDGTALDEDVQVNASYSSATEERIQAAEQANRTPQGHFTMPRMFHSHPAGQPWNPTFQQLIPGEPVIVTIRSNTYTAEPLVITLQDGEKKSIELRINRVGSAGEAPEAEKALIP